MTDHHIREMVDELMGDAAPHLAEPLTGAIGSQMGADTPPRAVVLRLDSVRAHSGGLRRQVTVLGPIEVYL